MKKIISALFLCMLFSAVPELQAQNIQLHYDFGRSLYDKDLKGRPLLTSTVEKFHPDNWGSTYFFIDMDYTSEGVASAYWESGRSIRTSNSLSQSHSTAVRFIFFKVREAAAFRGAAP